MTPPEIRLEGAVCELVAAVALRFEQSPEAVISDAMKHYASFREASENTVEMREQR
ncbi:hypothetical protein VD659_02245 [Herbiconiux sp. 11R-BC]|uniref:hypothetical protein n=1 Tax=Herbiconiux sp. 11R-BC TaxID=3111637 RepID=UPI003BFDB95C